MHRASARNRDRPYRMSFEEKKIVAAQFIERIEVTEDSAEIKWAV